MIEPPRAASTTSSSSPARSLCWVMTGLRKTSAPGDNPGAPWQQGRVSPSAADAGVGGLGRADVKAGVGRIGRHLLRGHDLVEVVHRIVAHLERALADLS